MRKSIAVISIIVFALLFAGCSFTPESAVKTYLEDIKTGKGIAVIEHLVNNDILPKIIANGGSSQENETAEAIELAENIVAKIRDFDYEVTGHNNNEDGTVDVFVNIKTYDLRAIFGDVIKDLVSGLLKDVFTAIFSDESLPDNTYADKIIASFSEKLNVAEKSFNESVSVKVEKNGLKWELVKGDDNKALFNAISGGILNDIDSLIKLLKENSSSNNNA